MCQHLDYVGSVEVGKPPRGVARGHGSVTNSGTHQRKQSRPRPCSANTCLFTASSLDNRTVKFSVTSEQRHFASVSWYLLQLSLLIKTAIIGKTGFADTFMIASQISQWNLRGVSSITVRFLS